MKKLLKLVLAIGLLSGAAYVLRTKLLPPPLPIVSPPPPFRRPEIAPPPSKAMQPTIQQPIPASEPAAASDAPTVDDLKVVKGIGPVFEKRLNALGVSSLGGLVRSDAADVADKMDVSEAQVDDWIRQARGLVY